MVRLKVVAVTGLFLESLFQYQYGAIKGQTVTGSHPYISIFQYQYGAIKGALR